MVSAFRWLERYTGFCVSVVEDPDAGKVLAAFGGTPSEAVRGGPREAQGCYAEEFGFRPVLRVVERGGWSVVVELFSAEALRAPVLQRLAELGRVVSFGLGEGGYRLGYADGAGVVVPVALRDGAVVARRAGVSVDGWPDEGSAHAAVEFVAGVSGVVLDDAVVKSPGLVGRVLPEVEVPALPARSEPAVRVDAEADDAAERAEQVWRDRGEELGLFAPDGSFLISLPGPGAFEAPWLRVRRGVGFLAAMDDSKDFVSMALSGPPALAVMEEEWEFWVLDVVPR